MLYLFFYVVGHGRKYMKIEINNVTFKHALIIDNKFNNLKLLFRDFDNSKIKINQQINDYAYLIDSKQGSYITTNNSFQNSITHTFDEIETPPIYCSLKFDNKYSFKKYLVIPINDFYFYQSEYINDFINLCDKNYILEFINKYGRKEMVNEISIFFKNNNYSKYEPTNLRNYNYLLYRNLVNLFINTYHKNKLINENAEILLYCKEYILFDYEKYLNNYYNKILNYKGLYKKLKINSLKYKDIFVIN